MNGVNMAKSLMEESIRKILCEPINCKINNDIILCNILQNEIRLCTYIKILAKCHRRSRHSNENRQIMGGYCNTPWMVES